MSSSIMGRIGAAISAVALLATGLVGVAAPAQADTRCATSGADKWYVSNYGGDQNLAKEAARQDGETKAPDICMEQGLEVTRVIVSNLQFGSWYTWEALGDPRTPTAEECEADGKVLNEAGDACRDKTEEEKCEEIDGAEWENGVCWETVVPIGPDTELCPDGGIVNGNCVPDAELPIDINCDWDAGEQFIDGEGCVLPKAPIVDEPVQKDPPPPPCWSGEAGNNCPVGGALRFAAPEYAMVGVPITMYAYASWRPDENSPAQPTNGTAVIRVDGEDYSGVEFKDGVAEWRFIPETEGMKEFTASGVVFSGLSGASAYIDTVPARTYVLEYDPAAYATAFKNKAVEVGEKYVITDPNQARSYLEGRYEFRVADKSEDVCAVYETKKGAVKAKFNEAGKCKVIWTDTESGDKGNFTFIAEK
jgi:hypothetical protein